MLLGRDTEETVCPGPQTGGSVSGSETPSPPVAAVILAAGGSTRMGELKQLLPIGGQPMVRRTAAAVCAAGLAQVVVVVGAQAEAVEAALDGLPLDLVRNPAWAEGMSTSLRAGLAALRPEIQAALVVLADQPYLTPAVLTALVERYRAGGAPIVAPVYRGRRGNPVLWDRALFAELAAAEGDRGGRLLLLHYEAQLDLLELDDPAVLLDVDTRRDYADAQRMRDEP